jgi:hypothetical protein
MIRRFLTGSAAMLSPVRLKLIARFVGVQGGHVAPIQHGEELLMFPPDEPQEISR